MKRSTLLVSLVFSLFVVCGITGVSLVFAGNTIMGCPESYFDSEKGCQLAVLPEYSEEYSLVSEDVGERMIMGCPESYFDSEKGCQLAVLPEYTEEYALVSEDVGERMIMDCPERYFDSEKGCQFLIMP